MPDTTCHMSISLDGFVAGPDQSREHPLGKRGRELHGWHLGDERANEADETAVGWLMRPRGAYVMGRNMFGPIRGEWEEDWRGWWGPEPPYHAPVFVLTHHAREPIEMEGGTTFHFRDTAPVQAQQSIVYEVFGAYLDSLREQAGIPGFNPVQDYVDYDVRTHHTNVDTYERIREDDLKQNAVVLAWFVFRRANWAHITLVVSAAMTVLFSLLGFPFGFLHTLGDRFQVQGAAHVDERLDDGVLLHRRDADRVALAVEDHRHAADRRVDDVERQRSWAYGDGETVLLATGRDPSTFGIPLDAIDKIGEFPSRLSGGQQPRVAIACASAWPIRSS